MEEQEQDGEQGGEQDRGAAGTGHGGAEKEQEGGDKWVMRTIEM